VDGREGPARPFDRKSDVEKDVTTAEAEALARALDRMLRGLT